MTYSILGHNGKTDLDLEATVASGKFSDQQGDVDAYNPTVLAEQIPVSEPAASSSLYPGKIIQGRDSYRLIAPLISERYDVYSATSLTDGRRVVVKEFTNPKRFKKEEYIQGILRSNSSSKHLLLADEFLPKRRIMISSLALGSAQMDGLLQSEKLTPGQASLPVFAYCAALREMHLLDMVYRDVKIANLAWQIPERLLGNINVRDLEYSSEIVPRLLDFETGWVDTPFFADNLAEETGTILGTAHYLSPEAILGATPDPRRDLYALGVAIFRLTTGRYPFTGERVIQIFQQHLSKPVPDLAQYNPAVTADFSDLVVRALAKDPEERYQSVDELERDWHQIVN